MGDSYYKRNEYLKEMGYGSYSEYLSSSLWRSIVRRVYQECGRGCRLCEHKATEIHHLGYGRKVLEGKTLKPLVPLCRECHERIEFTPDGTKRMMKEAHSAFMLLWNKVKSKPPNPVFPPEKRVKPTCLVCGAKNRKGSVHCRPCEKQFKKGLVPVPGSKKRIKLSKRIVVIRPDWVPA